MIADMCQVSHIARSHDMNSSWFFGFVRVDLAKKVSVNLANQIY
jgi:hypothetical protein